MLSVNQLGLGFEGLPQLVREVSFRLGAGQRLLICGATGSGKTTLLQAVAGVIPRLMPNPGYQGQVMLGGRPLAEISRDDLFQAINLVGQNVEEQLWDLSTEDLIAFPMENRAMARAEIRERVSAVMQQLDLTRLSGRRVLSLSGGERRMVAMAAALASGAKLLILDEPTTGLDPEARIRLRGALREQTGADTAVLIADQDPAALGDVVDEIALLSDGQLSSPRMPEAVLSADALWRKAGMLPPRAPRRAREPLPTGPVLLSVEGLQTRLARPDGTPILRDAGFTLAAGEAVAVLGRNGAGKTTLFKSLLGLLPIAAGKIILGGLEAQGWTTAKRARQIAYVPQNMRQILFNLTVIEEILFAITARAGAGDAAARAQASELLALYDLAGQEETNPFALSARQQGQLGLACAEATGAPIAIIDEPLLARDLRGRALLERFIQNMRAADRAVMVITHDLELADDIASRMLIVGQGGIAFDGPTEAGWQSDAFAALGWDLPFGLKDVD